MALVESDHPPLEQALLLSMILCFLKRSGLDDATYNIICGFFSVESTGRFLNASRRAIRKFSANVSEFVAENKRIIEEINLIIASLEDVHTRINAVKFSNFFYKMK